LTLLAASRHVCRTNWRLAISDQLDATLANFVDLDPGHGCCWGYHRVAASFDRESELL
jgi:hypothetical protein